MLPVYPTHTKQQIVHVFSHTETGNGRGKERYVLRAPLTLPLLVLLLQVLLHSVRLLLFCRPPVCCLHIAKSE
jgi:hypothetical protein